MLEFDEEQINYDVLSITYDRDYWKSAKVVHLGYGNLYSYVVANGYFVPYHLWVFEDMVEINEEIFYRKDGLYNRRTTEMYKKPRKRKPNI